MMTDQDTTIDESLLEREQQILDTALLESDQLLTRSLHDDDRRRQWRRIWWSALILGGVVMSGILFAVYAGWLAVSGPVTAEPIVKATKAETIQQEEQRLATKLEDLKWAKRLRAVTEKDRWSVGANIGMELVRIPGNRPYEILAANWNEIAANAKKQILKGFTPGMMGNKKTHPRFYDVMHLGMSDPNTEVRTYAATYLEIQGLPNFEHDLEAYQQWREKNKKLFLKQSQFNGKVDKADTKTEKATLDDTSKPNKSGGESAKATLSSKSEFQQAWKFFFKQEYTDSERLFRSVLKAEPKNANALNGLGWSLLNQSKHEQAQKLLQQSLEINPKHWGAMTGLAACHKHAGELDKAIKLWEFIAENSKGMNDATAHLAEIYLKRKQFEKAAGCYEKLVEWYPNRKTYPKLLDKAKAGLATKTE